MGNGDREAKRSTDGNSPVEWLRDQLRIDGEKIGSEPVWSDRVAEIFDILPDDLVPDINARLIQGRGSEITDFKNFGQRYGLTAAEVKIVESIAEGLSVPDHAAANGISVNTARVHMQRVLEKTGARRQTDLLRLVLTS
ncbi:helix-turn-helix transcriptional regulator [Parasphingopyxis sp.]|uniref:helix-turn-helix transcriptional regulator n=1 Tax=Parasphingopyxis sp. TaxID=1920299 RepID=UPI00260DBAC9|nr:helix-turn-helix transcriptional regulator [Parasphingopyxis sp.]